MVKDTKKKERLHHIPGHGAFNKICWCGGYHRIVRQKKTRSGHWYQSNLSMLEDIEI